MAEDRAALLEKLRVADAKGDDAEAARIADILYAQDAAAQPAAPVDDGVNPVAVEPYVDPHNVLWSKAKNYAESWVPEGDVLAAPDELLTGFARGFEHLPNIVPNTGNALKNLYDLHFGSGKGLQAEDAYRPWYDEQKFKEARPGWEGVSEYGETVGGAAPLALAGLPGVLAATVGVPGLTKLGGTIGAYGDKLAGAEDTHKWEQTGEVVAPLFTGGVRAVKAVPGIGKLAKKLPVNTGTLLAAATGTVSPETALAIMGAKMGIGGMDKLMVGKSGKLIDNLDRTVRETGTTLRQDEARRAGGPR